MKQSSRFARLALAAVTLLVPFAGCSRPPAEAPPAAVEAAPVAPEPVALTAEETLLAADLAAQATLQTAITRINPTTCAVRGNSNQNTIIDWEPTDPTAPDEVLWYAQGKPKGFSVVVEPKAGQSPQILAMFKTKYDSGPDDNRMLSGKPRNPPFGTGNEVRWKYSVIVYDDKGVEKCRLDPDICIRLPGGCSN
jgi:hypothetical protein